MEQRNETASAADDREGDDASGLINTFVLDGDLMSPVRVVLSREHGDGIGGCVPGGPIAHRTRVANAFRERLRKLLFR